jgi:hypothetical protein
MTSSNDPSGATPDPKSQPPSETHTDQGAPTDQMHEDAGDGTLAGSTPAGLTTRELQQEAESGKADNSATS